MGALSELNRRKCQPSGQSTEFWWENERIQKKHGCTQGEKQRHSPTPGNNRKTAMTIKDPLSNPAENEKGRRNAEPL